jgi:beta-aspartyl-peptidase (threonine type)
MALHGGAGVIPRARMTAARERAYRRTLLAALTAGSDILAAGGSSMDAVVAAVSLLEDSPLFNAGRGAVFTADGTNELDAAVMDGATLRAGAVTLATTVKNPVRLARLVMEQTPHVMLAGRGAEALARSHGLEIMPPAYFHTHHRWQSLQRIRQARNTKQPAAISEADKHGTVGAVALDRNGNLAAATSTGGRTGKLAGRVGDSPIIGAGTYADNRTAAVSCSGEGEYFMRTVAAHTLSALMELKGMSLKRAAEELLWKRLVPLGGSGGLIAVDRGGNIATVFSGGGMYLARVRKNEPAVVTIYADENGLRSGNDP